MWLCDVIQKNQHTHCINQSSKPLIQKLATNKIPALKQTGFYLLSK